MAIPKTTRIKPKSRSPIWLLTASVSAIALLYLLSSLISTTGSIQTPVFHINTHIALPQTSFSTGEAESTAPESTAIHAPDSVIRNPASAVLSKKQSSYTGNFNLFACLTFVMPSRMCINPIHNNKGILHHSENVSSEERWAASSCAMDSLYDLELISKKVPVILENSKTWFQVMSTSMKLGSRGVAHVEGVSRDHLKERSEFSKILLINRTASHLSWFMECKDRNNRSAVLLPHSYLPSMAAKKLRDVAEKIMSLLGDYDAIHVRRGDILKTRKDRFGVARTLHPHLDRDTRPQFILCRITKWVPPGRMLFIASNERTPNFFSPLSVRYKLAYSSNYSSILDPVVENNYQLFMIERLILAGARTYIKTYKETDADLSLTDDPKKNTKIWQLPVYTKQGC
ncbi:hypothetical protein SSX86_032719 [Deinandra increscens subsp. villosa]|uniref:O-fucosyltransferase family protein n=1 Tax=Deinandra increscens subsp. villosa TaxID=3103831 RepID=A0AAP0C6J0_9ASTR